MRLSLISHVSIIVKNYTCEIIDFIIGGIYFI